MHLRECSSLRVLKILQPSKCLPFRCYKKDRDWKLVLNLRRLFMFVYLFVLKKTRYKRRRRNKHKSSLCFLCWTRTRGVLLFFSVTELLFTIPFSLKDNLSLSPSVILASLFLTDNARMDFHDDKEVYIMTSTGIHRSNFSCCCRRKEWVVWRKGLTIPLLKTKSLHSH